MQDQSGLSLIFDKMRFIQEQYTTVSISLISSITYTRTNVMCLVADISFNQWNGTFMTLCIWRSFKYYIMLLMWAFRFYLVVGNICFTFYFFVLLFCTVQTVYFIFVLMLTLYTCNSIYNIITNVQLFTIYI